VLESWDEGISAASVRSPVVDEERMRPGHWSASQIWVSFSVFMQPIKNLCHLSPKVLFKNTWRKKTEEGPADPGLLVKWPLN